MHYTVYVQYNLSNATSNFQSYHVNHRLIRVRYMYENSNYILSLVIVIEIQYIPQFVLSNLFGL